MVKTRIACIVIIAVTLLYLLLTGCGAPPEDETPTGGYTPPAAEETGIPDGIRMFKDKFGRACTLNTYGDRSLDCDYPPSETSTP